MSGKKDTSNESDGMFCMLQRFISMFKRWVSWGSRAMKKGGAFKDLYLCSGDEFLEAQE